jgi:hypothetical protein
MKLLPMMIIIAIISISVSVVSIASERRANQFSKERTHANLKQDLENKCKMRLRAFGSVQLGYSDQFENHDYGNWISLQKYQWIQPGYTRSNIIEGYSISVFDTCLSTIVDGKSQYDSRFEIVAVPNQPNIHRLRTFGLCEEQTPLVWIGEDRLWRYPVNFPRHPIRENSLWAALR